MGMTDAPTPQDGQPRVKWLVIGVLVVLVGCGAWYAWGYFATKGSMQAANDRIEATTFESTVPSKQVTLDEASTDQFYDDNYFNDEQRVGWAWKKLNQPSQELGREGVTVLQAKHAELQARYNDPNSNYKYIEDLVEPSETMTGDQIRALQTTINNIAVDDTFSDSERTKILAAAYDNSYPNLRDAISFTLQKDVQSMNGIYRVDESDGVKWESPIFRWYRPENGYNPEGIPSKVISVMNVGAKASGGDFQEIYRFINGIPVRVDSYPATSTTKWISYPEKIPYQAG